MPDIVDDVVTLRRRVRLLRRALHAVDDVCAAPLAGADELRSARALVVGALRADFDVEQGAAPAAANDGGANG